MAKGIDSIIYQNVEGGAMGLTKSPKTIDVKPTKILLDEDKMPTWLILASPRT